MNQFRMVILDNPKEQLDSPVAQRLLSDMVFAKQKNFLRTDPHYVVTDKHDMIGTHYLIYDTTALLEPKLIFAIRTTYHSRSQEHRIDTPLLSLVPRLEAPLQNAFKDFQKKHPDIIDCNAWFVDVNYSKKNSGLNLSDLGYFMVCMNILREGGDHFVGCTNETYNASRWLSKVGSMPQNYLFEHPAVKAPHKLILMENFNLPHFYEIYQQNKDLIDGIYEVFPPSDKFVKLPEFLQQVFGGIKDSSVPKVA